MTSFTTPRKPVPPAEREAALLAALLAQIAHARSNAPAFSTILADVDPGQRHQPRRPGPLAGDAQIRAAGTPAGLRTDNVFGGFSAIGWRRHAAGVLQPRPDL